MNVNNEDKSHDDQEQLQESDSLISSVYNTHSNSKNQLVILLKHQGRVTKNKQPKTIIPKNKCITFNQTQ
jgi:hypothetical protein